MPIMADGRTSHSRTAPSSPIIIDPAEPPSVEMVPVGPGGGVLMPVLVLSDGIRIYVDALSADGDAALWWYDLSTAAATASLCYPPGGEPSR